MVRWRRLKRRRSSISLDRSTPALFGRYCGIMLTCPVSLTGPERTCELTSSIIPRGTSFHRSVELEFSPIGFDPAGLSCRCRGLFPGPAELSAINPYAVQNHGEPTRQRHDCLLH